MDSEVTVKAMNDAQHECLFIEVGEAENAKETLEMIRR